MTKGRTTRPASPHSSRLASLTASIRRPISLTCSHAGSTSGPPLASTSSCPGIGRASPQPKRQHSAEVVPALRLPELRAHLTHFVSAYNFAKRLKALKGLTPYEYIWKAWAKEPQRFTLNPLHQMPRLNIQCDCVRTDRRRGLSCWSNADCRQNHTWGQESTYRFLWRGSPPGDGS